MANRQLKPEENYEMISFEQEEIPDMDSLMEELNALDLQAEENQKIQKREELPKEEKVQEEAPLPKEDIKEEKYIQEKADLQKELEELKENYRLIKTQLQTLEESNQKIYELGVEIKETMKWIIGGMNLGEKMLKENLSLDEMKKRTDELVRQNEKGAGFLKRCLELAISPRFYKAVGRYDIEAMKIMCHTAKNIFKSITGRIQQVKKAAVALVQNKRLEITGKLVGKFGFSLQNCIDYLQAKREILGKSSQMKLEKSKEYHDYYKKAVSKDGNITVKDVYKSMMEEMKKNGLTLKESLKLMEEAPDKETAQSVVGCQNVEKVAIQR